MSTIYQRANNSVISALEKYGREALVYSETPSGSSVTPTLSIDSGVPVKVLALNINKYQVPQTMIQTGDKLFMMSSEVEITEGMLLKDGEEMYRILSYTVVAPGDTVIMYKVIARK